MAKLPCAICIALLLSHAASVVAEPPFRVLPRDFNADKDQQMMRRYLREQVHAALDKRREELESALKSADAFRRYQAQRRAYLRSEFQVGGDIEESREAPPAAVTGRLIGNGFSIEKLLIEAWPGYHITANLYRPLGDGPFPAILHPVGHTENGKAAGDYQRANQLLVAHGFIVLCYDPLGQGERKQLFSEAGEPLYQASGEHQQLGPGPILLGSDLGAYMVWDGVRALDYLCGRSDVKSTRIGCTGNSGGGNMTSFLMAYDSRIMAAAPGCFITTHRRKNERPGPGDAEQNLHGQIAAGFDHADFLLARAPRPTLILSATDDFVPIEGAWDTFRQAKRAYALLGHPQRVDLTEAKAKHGFSRRLRESATTFFCRWLQGRNITTNESMLPSPQIYSEKELRVTDEGQVLRRESEQSLLDRMRQQATELERNRAPLSRDAVRAAAQIRPLAAIPGCEVTYPSGRTGSPVKVVLQPEPHISLPGLYWPPVELPKRGGDNIQPVLIAPSDGMNSAVVTARRLHSEGHSVLIIEVRDIGETRTRNWRFFGADYYISHMLHRSWLGMQSEDILIASDWLRRASSRDAIQLIADGSLTPAASHAAYVEPQLITRTTLRGGLPSWRSLLDSPRAHAHLHECLHGGLQHYDIPQLRSHTPNLEWRP